MIRPSSDPPADPAGLTAPPDAIRLPAGAPLTDPRARLVLELVGYALGVPAETLAGRSHPSMLTAPRHIVFYLYATVFSVNATETGRTFARDRSTVQSALRRIEKARDAPAFEAWLQTLETILHLTPNLRGRA